MIEETKQKLYCGTYGKDTEHLHRDVLDSDYNSLMKPPLWNCDPCYQRIRAERLEKR